MSKDNKQSHSSKTSFDKLNTKSDPSQNGAIVPFQAGDFASSTYGKVSSKSVYEILVFYILDIGSAIVGYSFFVTLPIFKGIVNNTLISIFAMGIIILVSYVIAKLAEIRVRKFLIKKHNAETR